MDGNFSLSPCILFMVYADVVYVKMVYTKIPWGKYYGKFQSVKQKNRKLT